VKLGGGFDFGCALTATGSVLCWGDNDSKQLGQDAGVFDDAGSRYSNVALEVPGLSFPGGSILSSNLGEFECAQSASGIACWGDNSSGECLQSLALPTGFDTNVAGVLAEAGAALPVRSMALGEIHACALDGAGQVYCWGYGADGERGIPGYPPLAPNLVPGLVDAGVKQVACGRGWTCVLDAQSQVRCFGVGGAYGYLGNGPGEPVSAPDPVTVVDIDGGGALSSVARVYAGGTSTCAILTGSCGAAGPGPVVCWGYVPDLGAASVPEAGIPVPVLLP
jgi:alpha-tubulin suppressor-like RCC1 family protein